MRIGPKDAAIPTESGQVPSSATVKSKEKKGLFAPLPGLPGPTAKQRQISGAKRKVSQ